MCVELKGLHQMQHHHCSLNDTLILVMCDNTPDKKKKPPRSINTQKYTHRLRIVPH
jgi:hypothetical protein